MKPFITPEVLPDGRRVLRLQCENIDQELISKTAKSSKVVAYSMPDGHSFNAAWIFRLIFENNTSFEFSSACTMTTGWQEMGSLNVHFGIDENDKKSDIDKILVRVDFPVFRVASVAKLIYEEDNFCTECGLVFYGENKEEIVVSTGIPPGSVSVRMSFLTDSFEPEFPLIGCKREVIDGE